MSKCQLVRFVSDSQRHSRVEFVFGAVVADANERATRSTIFSREVDVAILEIIFGFLLVLSVIVAKSPRF